MTYEVLDDVFEDEGKSEQVRALEFRAKIESIIGGLEKDADDRIAKRYMVEQRWLADLAQFHGKYDDQTFKALDEAEKSTLFINQTRAKTNACEARLTDMLFPTDDRNWGIKPTPIPELTLSAKAAAQKVASAKQQSAQNPGDEVAKQRAQAATQSSDQLTSIIDEARKRAEAMTEEIEDHLRECKYSSQSRDAIHDACKLGTGIMKGPIVGDRPRKAWQQDPQTGERVMVQSADNRPVYWRVDPWTFYPDMDAQTIEDCEGNFELHRLNKKALRRLAQRPGFRDNADAFRRLLKDQPRSTTPYYISDLRSITGTYHDTGSDKYHVWEYHGPLSSEDMESIAQFMANDDLIDDAGLNDAEFDPLAEIEVTIWFCQGEILKFGLHHLDSGDSIYSVFCLEKDETSVFGFGVPYIMRDGQKALNAAWRTMMDNAGLSSGPQIIADPEVVEPANNVWGLQPRKLWLKKPGAPAGAKAFESFDVPMHQTELANIIELANRNIDQETAITQIAQGEQGSHVTQTAHGMSLLMNATNVVFRRIVKNYDDDMTTPNIRRMYDFLMQFSDKEHIKGDYEVDARGTSVLLVREMQSANLNAILAQYAGHPVLGRFLKQDGLPALRRLIQTMMIPADELIKSDDDLAAEAAAAADQPPEANPVIMELEAKMNLAEMERQTKLELAHVNRETEMMKLAAVHNIKLEDLRSRLAEGTANRASKERIMAAESAVTQRVGSGGGGYF